MPQGQHQSWKSTPCLARAGGKRGPGGGRHGLEPVFPLATSIRMQWAAQTSCLGSAENAHRCLKTQREVATAPERRGRGLNIFQSTFPKAKSEFPGTQVQVHHYYHSHVSCLSPQKGEQGKFSHTPVSMDLFIVRRRPR